MYQRKTANAVELSAALSRAARSRKVCRGGRPKGWRKDPGESQPVTSAAVGTLDLGVIRNYAAKNGVSVRAMFHILAACLVKGFNFKAHPELAPQGWVFRNPLKPKPSDDGR